MSGADDRHAKAAALLASGQSDAAVADAVGVTARTIRRWRSDGKIPEAPGAEDPAATLAEARRRKEAALAELRELEVAKRRGELVDAELVARGWAERARSLREQFLAWPGRIAAELAADLGVDAGEVGAALEGYVRRFLTEVADDPVQAEDEAA